MLDKFLDGIIAIDDKKEEVEIVKEMCEFIGCEYDYYNPSELKQEPHIRLKNRRLIFLDLHIFQDNMGGIENHISLIRTILENNLGKDYGAYGIVLWTNHDDEFGLFIKKLDEDKKKSLYTMPLFVVCCRKLQNVKPEQLLSELEQQINGNLAANFFVHWMNDIKVVTENMYNEFYNLLPTYANNSNYFNIILAKIHQQLNNDTSQLLEYDMLYAFKFFDEILNGKLYGQHQSSKFSYKQIENNEYENFKNIINTKINTLLYFDENISNDNILSGNMYIICGNDNLLDINNADITHKNSYDNIIPVAIDLTPPCDIANGKYFYHRLVGGYLVSNEKKKCNAAHLYHLDDVELLFNNVKYTKLIIDFRLVNNEKQDKLCDNTSYKLILRLMPNIFADILQKFSSHAARLGRYDSIL